MLTIHKGMVSALKAAADTSMMYPEWFQLFERRCAVSLPGYTEGPTTGGETSSRRCSSCLPTEVISHLV